MGRVGVGGGKQINKKNAQSNKILVLHVFVLNHPCWFSVQLGKEFLLLGKTAAKLASAQFKSHNRTATQCGSDCFQPTPVADVTFALPPGAEENITKEDVCPEEHQQGARQRLLVLSARRRGEGADDSAT